MAGSTHPVVIKISSKIRVVREKDSYVHDTSSIALDSIWKARNKLIFDEYQTETQSLVHEIQGRTDLVRCSIEPSSLSQHLEGKTSPCMTISWTPPPYGGLKLNCDGAVKANGGQAACGGILREDSGRPRFAYLCHVGPSSVINAELWAIYYGLKLIKEKGYTEPIHIESDSALAIRMLKDGVLQHHECYNMLNSIVALAKDIHLESYMHIFREANSVADALAKKGLEGTHGLHVFSSAPACAILPLLADAANVHFYRGF